MDEYARVGVEGGDSVQGGGDEGSGIVFVLSGEGGDWVYVDRSAGRGEGGGDGEALPSVVNRRKHQGTLQPRNRDRL